MRLCNTPVGILLAREACTPRYKPTERNGLLLPVVLSEQIQPGSFEFALDHLVEHELDLRALDAKFNNDQTGASAYDPL